MGQNSSWTSIRNYPGYYISEDGEIISNQTDPPEVVNAYMLGGMYVVHIKARSAFHPHVVSVDSLMVDTLIEVPEKRELYNLVHIDGDLTNCKLSNYGWVRKFIPKSVRK